MWPFRRRHTPDEAPAVIEAREVRDALLDQVGEANRVVDGITDRIIDDYEDAEEDRLRENP